MRVLTLSENNQRIMIWIRSGEVLNNNFGDEGLPFRIILASLSSLTRVYYQGFFCLSRSTWNLSFPCPSDCIGWFGTWISLFYLCRSLRRSLFSVFMICKILEITHCLHPLWTESITVNAACTLCEQAILLIGLLWLATFLVVHFLNVVKARFLFIHWKNVSENNVKDTSNLYKFATRLLSTWMFFLLPNQFKTNYATY